MFNSFPKLKHNLVLYRGGSATGKRVQKDAINEYSNVVSCSTSIDAADKFAKSSQIKSDNLILYRHTIEAGKNMLSLDSIPQFGKDIIALLKEQDEFDDYRKKDNEVLLDNLQYQSNCHGVNHTRRVLFMAKTLAVLGKLDLFEEELLLTAIKYHDIGRENDDEDTSHGKKSVDKISQHLEKLSKFDHSDQELIFF